MILEALKESGADAISNREDGFPLGQSQREVVHVSRNMVDVPLVEGSLNQIEQPSRNAPAFKLASPNICVNFGRQGPSNSFEHPFQAVRSAIRLAPVVYDAYCGLSAYCTDSRLGNL